LKKRSVNKCGGWQQALTDDRKQKSSSATDEKLANGIVKVSPGRPTAGGGGATGGRGAIYVNRVNILAMTRRPCFNIGRGRGEEYETKFQSREILRGGRRG